MMFAPMLALLLAAAPVFPRIDHVVVVIEENKSPRQIVGNRSAPYINSLISRAALFVNARAVTHPSQPNYMALFSGLVDTNGDGCPAAGIPANAPNLGSELLAAHRTFAGYAESLPSAGFLGCSHGDYARKHAPWVQFSNIPGSDSRPLDALTSYDELPAVALIIPNLKNDMHSGSIAAADTWLRDHLGNLFAWGSTHNTLFVITWDEGGGWDPKNLIPTFFFGPMIKPGRYSESIDHYAVLRTLEDIFRLPPTGAATRAKPITDVWR
ncbi:MAG: alkaline phosphatase family protein [Vulcanimicrobiaceae bacterium]